MDGDCKVIQSEENLKVAHKLVDSYGKVRNHAGGYVNKISDLERLERYVIMGSEGGSYYVMEEKLTKQNIDCLDRIIAAGDGMKAVRLIEDVSVNKRNVKQNSLLRALAVCARCNDNEIKRAAYTILPRVCRIPTFLFQFVEYCQERSDEGTGKCWGRAPKKALSEWYKSFKDEPEKLARYITKFKSRDGWEHKDLIRLAHTKVTDSDEIAFILRYIVKGFDQAKDMYMSGDRIDDIPQSLQRVADLLSTMDNAKSITEETHLIRIIREYKLTWEQCPTHLLRSKEVWKALLPHMGIEATIKNLGRMTALGAFPENSPEEETVIKKIDSINKLSGVQEEDEDMETEDERKVIKKIGTNFLHPFKVLIGLVIYKQGKGEKGKLTWIPNERIIDALDRAFYKAFQNVVPTKKKYYLAVDVSGSMSQPVLGTSSINCATAAAAMMMATIKTEDDTIVRGFSHVMRDIDIEADDKLEVVMKKVDAIMMGATDCALPMMDAMEHKIRDVDVFVVYTDNETWFGKVHPAEALKQYRQWSDRKDAKLIVCGMCASEFTIAEKDDKNMLDVVGFDSEAPRVISLFASGKICKEEK